MVINYRDHLLDACNYAKFSQIAFQNPGLIDEPMSFSFEFSLNCDIELLNRQASLFSSEVLANKVLFKCIKDNYYGKKEEIDREMFKIYKYSFFKTFLICNEIALSDRFSVGTVIEGNRIFWGHKELYLNFLAGRANRYNRMASLYKTELRRRLKISFKDKAVIEADPVYKENYNAVYPCFLYNSSYERILEALSEHKDYISVTTFNEGKNVVDPEFSPLGSCFFSKDGENLAYARSGSAVVDFISKFWNTANFIKIESFDSTFDDENQPFGSTLWETVSKKYVYAEVQAITGLNVINKFSNQGNVQAYGTPGTSGGGTPQDPKGNGGNGPSKPKNPKGKGGNKLGKLAKDTKDVIFKHLDDVMRDKNTGGFIKDAALVGLNFLANYKKLQIEEKAKLNLLQEYLNSGRVIEGKSIGTNFGLLNSQSYRIEQRPLELTYEGKE